jgi:hypothetical protein
MFHPNVQARILKAISSPMKHQARYGSYGTSNSNYKKANQVREWLVSSYLESQLCEQLAQCHSAYTHFGTSKDESCSYKWHLRWPGFAFFAPSIHFDTNHVTIRFTKVAIAYPCAFCIRRFLSKIYKAWWICRQNRLWI